jgi:MEMO1 family protein
MSQMRQAAVAGRFYPAARKDLEAMIRRFLAGSAPAGSAPKAIIVPHAGYEYSGPVAGSAYSLLQQARGKIRRVILLGTSHVPPFHGLATSGADAFETPLGPVPLDREAIRTILSLPQVRISDEAHAHEHSLEVQLPFLQETLGSFSLVPLAVSEATAREVEDVLALLWGGPETLIVISSDLSHYRDYETARRMDEATSRAIEALEPDRIAENQACGRNAINGLLTAARHYGLRARTVDLRNSGDTAGPRDQVVGYGAYVFEPASEPLVNRVEAKLLLQVARRSIENGLSHGVPLPIDAADFPAQLKERGATFVTLEVDGELRGCIGTIRPHRPLVEDVAENAFASAFTDGRFGPITRPELRTLTIHLSILSPLQPIDFHSEADLLRQIRPGIDGLLWEEGVFRGTLLPSMWDSLETPQEFLACLKAKAGLPEDHWSSSVKVFRFTAQSI